MILTPGSHTLGELESWKAYIIDGRDLEVFAARVS